MNTKIVVGGLTAIVSLTAGSVMGYLFALRQLEKKYDETLIKEIAETKAFYEKMAEKRSYETPQDAVETLVPAAAAALRNYQGMSKDNANKNQGAKENLIIFDEIKAFGAHIVKNVFDEGTTEELPDEEKRNRTEEAPYILEKEEFFSQESDYTQSTLTWFAGDGILIDSREDIINEVDETVGENNLVQFGHGSGDPNVVYVRNDAIDIEFEILRHEGTYKQHVAGLGK